jgi:deoxyribonuclease-4
MAFKLKIGLKLYSTDTDLIPDSITLLEKTLFDYIELYVIPGSFETTISKWTRIKCPYIIHAPHSYHGINFAQAAKWELNMMNFNVAQSFANKLGSETIIIHGGNNGIRRNHSPD